MHVHRKGKACFPGAYLCFLGAFQARHQVYGTYAVPIFELTWVRMSQ